MGSWKMKMKGCLVALVVLGLECLFCSPALSQREDAVDDQAGVNGLGLAGATMCEVVVQGKPVNEAVVFSTDRERVCCFTTFDPVPEETLVYHLWVHRDTLVARIKLTLKPPRWSTYSSIHLREADKGPWRVEIVDQQDRILETIRFSITD
jgi:hypothetical protein